MQSRLLLIDGNSLFHRAYHALPPITDKSGEVANAVFGFSNMLIKATNEIKPTHVVCAFDTQAPTFRHIEFEKYKATRPAPPADLYPQLPKVKKVLDAFGIVYFEKEGYEADDLIATIASKAISRWPLAVSLRGQKTKGEERSAISVVILSGDRDCLQLVDGNVKVQMPSFTSASAKAMSDKKVSEGKPGWGVLVGAKEVREKYGLEPHQMVDYKSLVGDPSDNVPGISGIGPKTAAILLQKYRTLENLFAHIGETPEPLRSKLEAGRDVALAAKKLVELDRNVDIEFRVKSLEFRPDWNQVRREYEELGFKSIVAKLPGAEYTSEVGFDSSEVKTKKKQKVSPILPAGNREHKTESKNQLELI